MTDQEEWRPAPGVEHYEVSSLGRVRTRLTASGVPRVLTGSVGARGYTQLRPSAARPPVRLHRLVCEAFHGPAPEGCRLVRHLDDNKQNNRPENLAWGTDLDNYRDGVRNGVMRELPPRKRLFSLERVAAMREAHAAGRSINSLAKEAGVSQQSLTPVIKGHHYRDAPMPASVQ